jgi:hypothetical protein
MVCWEVTTEAKGIANNEVGIVTKLYFSATEIGGNATP